MASGSGWTLWVWLAGCGWNLWSWLVGVFCKEVYIYIIDFLILLIPTPLVSFLFCSSILLFCSFFIPVCSPITCKVSAGFALVLFIIIVTI